MIAILIFNSVEESGEFLLQFSESKMCLLSDNRMADNNSSLIGQLIEFHNISEDICENKKKDEHFSRSVHFIKFNGFGVDNPDDSPSVFLVTKEDIARIAEQYRALNVSNISKNSVKSSEELNLEHFLKYFYESLDFLRERSNFAKFIKISTNLVNKLQDKISEFTNQFTNQFRRI